jgi:hypothetical protein
MYNLDLAKKSGLIKEDHFNRRVRQSGREHEQIHKHWRKENKRLKENNISLMIDEETGALAEVDADGNMVKFGDEYVDDDQNQSYMKMDPETGEPIFDMKKLDKMAEKWSKEKVLDGEEEGNKEEESMEEYDEEEGGDDDDEDEDMEELEEEEEEDDDDDEEEFDEDDEELDEDEEFDEDEDFEDDDEEYEEDDDEDDDRTDQKKDQIKEFEVDDDEDEFDEKIGRGPRSGGRKHQ